MFESVFFIYGTITNSSNSSVPPSIDGPAEENVVETISNPVAFTCDATGIPPPSLTWLKNGHTIGTVIISRQCMT